VAEAVGHAWVLAVGVAPSRFARKRLLKSIVLGNLVTLTGLVHTRITYHRTWETGLEVAACRYY
jgi:hypothetical protein